MTLVDPVVNIERWLNTQGLTSVVHYRFDSEDNDPVAYVWPRGTDILGEENDLTQAPWTATDASVTVGDPLEWDDAVDWYVVEATTAPTGRIQQSSLTVAAATYICHVLVKEESVNDLDFGVFIGAWIPPDSQRILSGSGSLSVVSNRISVTGLDSNPTLIEAVWTLSAASSALFRINPGTAAAQQVGDSVNVGPCRLALLSELPYFTYPGTQVADYGVNGLHLSYIHCGTPGLPASAPALKRFPVAGTGRAFASTNATNFQIVGFHENPLPMRPLNNQCYAWVIQPGGSGSGDYLYQCYVDASNYLIVFLNSDNTVQTRIRIGGTTLSINTDDPIVRDGATPITLMLNLNTSGCSIFINGVQAAVTASSTAGAHGVGLVMGARFTSAGVVDLTYVDEIYDFRLISGNVSATQAAVYNEIMQDWVSGLQENVRSILRPIVRNIFSPEYL